VNVRRSEDHFHTPEQVNGYIEQAIVLLDEHALEPGERARLFPHVFDALAAKNVTYEQVAPAGMLLPQNARH
jgi:hypothetical protein